MTSQAPAPPIERAAVFALLGVLSVLFHLPHLLGLAHPNLDFESHTRWALETAQAMAGGDPWPRWMTAGKGGLGEPVLLFYSPLYYLVTGLMRFVTGTTWMAMQVVGVAATLACGWLSWALVRAWAGPRTALLAGCLGVLNPMAALLTYGFNGFPWATAFAPLTLMLWGLLRPGAERRSLNIVAMIGLALTICTHTVSGLMGVVCVCALPLRGLSRDGGRWRLDLRPALSVFLTISGGLLLSAAYLLPALAARPLINSAVWQESYTPFNAFALSTVTAWVFGIRWFAFQWPIALVLTTVVALSVVAVPRASITLRAGLLWPAALICLLSLFLATELSYPLWLPITPLRYVQFPHRFLTITSVAGPILAMPALASLVGRKWVARALGAALVVQAGMAAAVVAKDGFMDGRPTPFAVAVADRLVPWQGWAEYDLSSAGPDWKRYLAEGGFTAECARRHVACSPMARVGRAMTWHVDAAAATELVLPVFNFPALHAVVGGQDAVARRDPATGLIVVVVPAGKATVAVEWRMLPTELAGLGITGFTLLGLTGLGLLRRVSGRSAAALAVR
jgi:hypothetical protein